MSRSYESRLFVGYLALISALHGAAFCGIWMWTRTQNVANPASSAGGMASEEVVWMAPSAFTTVTAPIVEAALPTPQPAPARSKPIAPARRKTIQPRYKKPKTTKTQKPSRKSKHSKPSKPVSTTSKPTQTGVSTVAGGGTAPHVSAAQTDWYRQMLRDRFYAQWEQPRSAYEAVQKFRATVRLRIEKDGRISQVALVRSSGLLPMDDSVLLAARRVKKVEAPPVELLSNGVYQPNIEFVREN